MYTDANGQDLSGTALSTIEGGSADRGTDPAATLDDVGSAAVVGFAFGSIVANTTAAPFNAIVHIFSTIGSSVFQGSGVLIAPDEVLTASHMVWSTDGGGAASSVAAMAGQDEAALPYGSVKSTAVHFNPINDAGGSISTANSVSDYALVHLSQPIFSSTMQINPNFTGGSAHDSAYPAAGIFDGKQLIDISSAGVTSSFGLLTFDPDASFQGKTQQVIEPGSSGGPVWVTDAAGRPSVVGVNSSLLSSFFGLIATNTTAAAITPAAQAQIVGWYLSDHPSSFAASHDAAESSLFDAAYYLIKYPDIMAAGADPMQHFATAGWTERRNPDLVFDVAYYLAHNPDVARAGIDPLLQYAEYGWKEGRDPSASFSTSHYLAVNTDVKLAGLDPLQHYLQFGIAEHRHI